MYDDGGGGGGNDSIRYRNSPTSINNSSTKAYSPTTVSSLSPIFENRPLTAQELAL